MHTIISKDLGQAIKFLKSGELVAIPTETVYGLAANALNTEAVLKIFTAKERPSFNPLIVHVHSFEQVKRHTTNIPEPLMRLMQQFWPGPLTVLLPKQQSIADLVTSGSTKVGLRMPAHPLTQQLLRALPFPLAAPSANLFGYVSPTSAQHVYDGLKGRIAMVLDGGDCKIGLESTIVDFEDGEVIIRRNGGIEIEAVEDTIGVPVKVETAAATHPVAPGLLKSHYATRKPIYFLESNTDLPGFVNHSFGVLGWGEEDEITKALPVRALKVESLSASKNLNEAGAKLFALLRKMDADATIDAIIALPVVASGIGIAINDRLRRADHRNK